MKKTFIIILIIILCILISVIIYNKIILNSNEKEIMSVLKDFDNTLQNIEPSEDNTYNFNPLEPTTLKQYISKIYEARKYTVENGTLFFLFRVEFSAEEGDSDNILMISNGKIITRTVNEDFLNNLEQSTDDLSAALQKVFFTKVNTDTRERWDNSEKITNINFEKILNKI